MITREENSLRLVILNLFQDLSGVEMRYVCEGHFRFDGNHRLSSADVNFADFGQSLHKKTEQPKVYSVFPFKKSDNFFFRHHDF